MYRGSSIELNALRESWRCRKCQKLGYCMFGSRQGAGNSKKWLLLVLGRESFLSGSVSRQEFLCRDRNFCVATWFHILSHKNCRNMAFLVATGVLVLCRDGVATKVSLSRRGRSRREVRVVTRSLFG